MNNRICRQWKRVGMVLLMAWPLWVEAAPPDRRSSVLIYDFNNATLQGWNNRVWNGSAWVDLAANATTYTGTLLPASSNNGLFAPGRNAVWVNGNTDAHLNTLWLRSPYFYLNYAGNLTVQLAKGQAHTTVPANEAAVPYAAINGGGWKGVALRRVRDGAFVLTKPRTSSGDTWMTVTFTQAELAPLVTSDIYSLDLINSDCGGWGWLTMDNVSIPGSLAPVQVNNVTSMTFPTFGAAAISGTSISLSVPYGTTVTALAPTYTLSSGATCVPASGTSRNFTSPVHYVVTGADHSTKDYVVTVTAAPSLPGGITVAPALWLDAAQLTSLTNGDLKTWTEDTTASASQVVSSTIGDVQSVSVHVTTMPSGGKIFVRIKAQ